MNQVIKKRHLGKHLHSKLETHNRYPKPVLRCRVRFFDSPKNGAQLVLVVDQHLFTEKEGKYSVSDVYVNERDGTQWVIGEKDGYHIKFIGDGELIMGDFLTWIGYLEK